MKKGDKDGEALYKLTNDGAYGKPVKNLRNRINAKLEKNGKYHLKWISKPIYISHKIFDSNLVVIWKEKITLILNKPTYFKMCILDLNNVIMYKLHCDYINNKHGNKLWLSLTDIHSSMYKIKTEDISENVSKDKKMFEADYVPIKKLVGLKPKRYSFLVDDSSEYKKPKGLNKDVAATILHN